MSRIEDPKILEREEKKLQTIFTAFKNGTINVFDRYTESQIICKYVLNHIGQSVLKPSSMYGHAKILYCNMNLMKNDNINDTNFYPINVDAVKDEIAARFEKFDVLLIISELYIGPDIP
jgi:hypothetical protein